ncbi:MAG TPA: hypothetical protein VK943_11740 [Arenibaculum sp.]|nr:hypothetical protein [Arenibaculum sp.]
MGKATIVAQADRQQCARRARASNRVDEDTDGMTQASVVVIGAGIVGMATALALLMRGAAVARPFAFLHRAVPGSRQGGEAGDFPSTSLWPGSQRIARDPGRVAATTTRRSGR